MWPLPALYVPSMIDEPTAPHDEASRELTAMLTGKLGSIPPETIVDHLMSIYGASSWPVMREAARAILRRHASAAAEELKLATRPVKGSCFGAYTTRRSRQNARPYKTLLRSVQPLWMSCDCPDFLKGGLGVCKHGLTVLDELCRGPRLRARLLSSAANGPAPRVSWWPVLPMEGPNDWLEGVRLSAVSKAEFPAALRGLCVSNNATHWTLDPTRLSTRRDRERVIDSMETLLRRRRGLNSDPALLALLRREREYNARTEALTQRGTRLRSALKSFRYNLFPYQQVALDKFFATGRMLLADDMGLGKTIQGAAISHVMLTNGQARRVLILAPASLKSQWVREWRAGTDFPIEVVEGPVDARARTYHEHKSGALVANYEQALRDLELMQAWKPELVILDEAQRIKNWATRTAKTIKQLDVPYRLVLTGTPLENRIDELASIMDWVDPFVLAPKWRLAPAHQILADGKKEVVGIRDLNVLRSRLAPRMLRRSRAEVLGDLPERTDTIVPVELTKAQRVAHDDFNQPIAQLVSNARKRPLTQAQFLRLMSMLTTQRMIANGMAQYSFTSMWPVLSAQSPNEAAIASAAAPKLSVLQDLIQSVAVDQGRKIVVFSQWRRMLKLAHWSISEMLEKKGLRAAFFTGNESQKRRTQNVIEFHDDPTLRVLFLTDAGGVGLNLQRAANCCINIELPWNPAVLEQRIARIHRLGQPDPVNVYTLVSLSSIEERIASAVSAKQKLFSGLFDSSTDEVMFGGPGGFLASVEKLVDADTKQAAASGSASSEGHDVDEDPAQELPSELEHAIEAADERGVAETEAEPAASMLPAPEKIQALFSQLEIRPRDDGGIRIDASPEAARSLGALFSGMARLLEEAGKSPRSSA